MTTQEYTKIIEALEDCQRSIEKSFDKYIENIKNLRDDE